jgi:hypothetical protein
MSATPTIADARALGKKYGLKGVVIIHHDGNLVGYASWGHDRAECPWMRRYADKALSVLTAMWVKER